MHAREVYKAAVRSNAHSILVALNHPAGSLEPSLDDIATTKTLFEASVIMRIPLLDHVIVTNSALLSVRESYGYLRI